MTYGESGIFGRFLSALLHCFVHSFFPYALVGVGKRQIRLNHSHPPYEHWCLRHSHSPPSQGDGAQEADYRMRKNPSQRIFQKSNDHRMRDGVRGRRCGCWGPLTQWLTEAVEPLSGAGTQTKRAHWRRPQASGPAVAGQKDKVHNIVLEQHIRKAGHEKGIPDTSTGSGELHACFALRDGLCIRVRRPTPTFDARVTKGRRPDRQ